jgi:hypothetical protein
MKLSTGMMVAVLLLAGTGTGHAAVRIANDQGGRLAAYIDKFRQLRDSGEFVIIDGLCAAACTIVLGAIPRDRICLTPNARFGFLAARDWGGNAVAEREATQMLYSMYPSQVRLLIAQQGGLTEHMIVVEGRQLKRLYRPCSIGAHASDSRPH